MRVGWLWAAIWVSLLVSSGMARASAERPCAPTDAVCAGDPEAWVKHRIARGERADLDFNCPDSDTNTCRLLRPAFVRQIIVSASENSRAGEQGISIRNATICASRLSSGSCANAAIPPGDPRAIVSNGYEQLDLRNLRAKVAVDLVNNLFWCDVQLGGSYFEHILNLDDVTIVGSVDMHNMRSDGNISLVNTQVLGDLDADWLRSAGSLKAFHATIHGSFHMRGAMLGLDLDLGRLDVTGPWHPIKDSGEPRASVGTPRSGVDLSNTHVGRQVYLSGATVWHSDVDLSGMTIGGSLWMEKDTRIPWHMTLERTHIGDSLLMGSGTFNQVDLTSAQIDHELRLETGGVSTIWQGGRYKRDPETGETEQLDKSTWLVLRHAKIAAIRDTLVAWPDCLVLDGFVYDRPPQDLARRSKSDGPGPVYRWCGKPIRTSSMNSAAIDRLPYRTEKPITSFLARRDRALSDSWARIEANGDLADIEPEGGRSVIWWRNWLERDPGPTAQSYAQLATTLETTGNGTRADGIRFERRIFERNAADWPQYVLAWAEEILVGFGIGSYALFSAGWVLVCTSLLTWRLRRRLTAIRLPEATNKGLGWCFFACLQTLIPVVVFSKQMDEFLHTPILTGQPSTRPLHGSLAVGFAFCAVLGLVLSGFLIHGLQTYAGL